MRVISAMADNAAPFFEAVCAHLHERYGLPVEFYNGATWQERMQMLYDGRAHLGFVCGLPYLQHLDHGPAVVEPVVAPVMDGPRYGGEPIYFSDVVVRVDSPYATFADLRARRVAYNEPGSHSGHNVLLYHLATLGEMQGYFAAAIASGAHQASLRMVVDGTVDAAVIDTTVLDTEITHDPTLQSRLRAVATLGPSPMPPALLRLDVDAATRAQLLDALIKLHEDEAGRALLHRFGRQRFAAMTDVDYNPIRHMMLLAHQVRL